MDKFKCEGPEPVPRTKRECSIPLLIAGCASTIGAALPAGYNIGVINAPSPIIKEFCNASVHAHYGRTMSVADVELLWSLIVSIFLVGGMIGSLSGSWVANRVGRKGAYIVSSVLGILSAVLFYMTKMTNSVEMLVIARFLVGLAGGIATTTVPMHLSELAPLGLRGMMGVLYPLGLTLGVLLAQIMGLQQLLGTEESWPYLLSLYAVLIVASAMSLPWMPESPKYLFVVKNQPQAGVMVLSKVRGVPIEQLSDEVEELRVSKHHTEGTQWSVMAVLRSQEMLLPLLLTCALQAGQQLSGINAVFYYSVSIFQSAGLSLHTSQLVNMGAGGMNLLMAVVAIFLNQVFDRRVLVQLSCLTASVCLVLLGVSVTYIESFTWMPYVAIVTLLAYVFCYQLGLGPIPYFIGAELFEIGPRSSAMALGSLANWGANFLIGMSFPSLQISIGASTFHIFAILTFLLLLFLRRYLPETRNRNASQVAAVCKHGFKSRPLEPPPSVTAETTVAK